MVSIKNTTLKDFSYAIILGLLSALLGFIQFKIPGYENSYTDLREIPLLLALAYLSRPWFIIILSTITLISIPEGAPHLASFIFHVIPLFIVWPLIKWVELKKLPNLKMGFAIAGIVVVYYIFLVLPLVYWSYYLVGYNTSQSFLSAYPMIVKASLFEIVTTTSITSLFIVQYEIRNTLAFQNKNLENIIEERTFEIAQANKELQVLNEELIASNEEVKTINDNLEQLVKQRTEKIKEQLMQLSKYAHMNSHEVRAPLARMLGLITLLKNEKEEIAKEDILKKLCDSCEELDLVIGKMNNLLEQEVYSEKDTSRQN